MINIIMLLLKVVKIYHASKIVSLKDKTHYNYKNIHRFITEPVKI